MPVKPLFGICLGNQLLGRAAGARARPARTSHPRAVATAGEVLPLSCLQARPRTSSPLATAARTSPSSTCSPSAASSRRKTTGARLEACPPREGRRVHDTVRDAPPLGTRSTPTSCPRAGCRSLRTATTAPTKAAAHPSPASCAPHLSIAPPRRPAPPPCRPPAALPPLAPLKTPA